MSELILTEKQNITAIADAIRSKTNLTEPMTLSEMADSIDSISTSGCNIPELITVSWETQHSSWSPRPDATLVLSCSYIGIDQNNNLTKMTATGETGTIQSIPSVVEFWTEAIDSYPMVENISSNAGIIDYYLAAGGYDSSLLAVPINRSQHLIFSCTVEADWDTEAN